MDNILDSENNTNIKLYKEHVFFLSAFLGGPLAAGYVIAKNFTELGEKDKANKTWHFTIAFTIVFIFVLLIAEIPENFPSTIFPIIYSVIFSTIGRQQQGTRIREHIANGGATFSGWNIFSVVIIGFASVFAFMLAMAYFMEYTFL